METKIASYQEYGTRLQLIEITREDIGSDGIPTDIPTTIYQIRKNRKVICNFIWITPAKQKFNSIIQQHLLQTRLDL